MCIKERNASDSTCKKLLRDEGCFADLCNYAFFQGRQVIKPEELVSRENDLSTLIGNIDDSTEIKRYRDVVEISQSMFAGNYDDLRNNRKIETESFMMAATFTCTNIRREDLPEEDEINMCKAMDQLFQRTRDERKLNTLKELLKVKLGTLSSPLEKQLTNTLLEKLNELTLNIFNINSEEEVLKIINKKINSLK